MKPSFVQNWHKAKIVFQAPIQTNTKLEKSESLLLFLYEVKENKEIWMWD